MSNKLSVRFIGQIVPTSPINISRPDDKRTPGVPQMAMMINGQRVDAPFIPGETIKGRLRRNATQILLGYIAAAQGRNMADIPLETYYNMAIGGVKGSEKESLGDIVRADMRRSEDPLSSLFGSATPWLQGRAVIHMAIPALPTDVAIHEAAGVRRDDVIADESVQALMSSENWDAYTRYRETGKEVSVARQALEEASTTRKKLSMKRDRSPEETIELERLKTAEAAAKSQLETLKDDNADNYKNAIGRPLDKVYGIAVGSILQHQIDMLNTSPVEVGLMLEALAHWGNDCRIGGHKTTGWGRINVDYAVMLRDQKGVWQPAGTIAINNEGYQAQGLSADLTATLEAWRAFASNPDNILPLSGKKA